MTTYAQALVLFACLVGTYIMAVYLLIRWPGRFGLLRRLVAWANGMTSLDSRDVVFQDNPFGCGFASLKMLARQLNANSLERTMDEHGDDLCLFSMLDLVDFVNQNGLTSRGYEFRSIDELQGFLSEHHNAASLLLLRPHETVLSPASLLMKPVYFTFRVLKLDGQLGRDTGHWVLLQRIGKECIEVKDPFFGRVRLARKRFEKLWDGHGMLAYAPQRVME